MLEDRLKHNTICGSGQTEEFKFKIWNNQLKTATPKNQIGIKNPQTKDTTRSTRDCNPQKISADKNPKSAVFLASKNYQHISDIYKNLHNTQRTQNC